MLASPCAFRASEGNNKNINKNSWLWWDFLRSGSDFPWPLSISCFSWRTWRLNPNLYVRWRTERPGGGN